MQTLLNLLASVALLVWGTHIVRTGILRVYGASLRHKLANHLKAVHLDLASEELLTARGLHAGFRSPIGIKDIRMVLDTSVGDQNLYTAGANEIDWHYRNVVSGRDFTISECVDISEVRHGDRCAHCQQGILEIRRGIELGHTFKLGTKYTDQNSMDVTYLNDAGEQQQIIMGCYGIGVERLMASAVEQSHDDAGIVWPITIAPFQVMLTALGQKGEVPATAEKLYEELRGHYEVLYDDRTESAGVKFKDADLLDGKFHRMDRASASVPSRLREPAPGGGLSSWMTRGA